MNRLKGTWLSLITLAAGALGCTAQTLAVPQANLEATVKGNNTFALPSFTPSSAIAREISFSPRTVSRRLWR